MKPIYLLLLTFSLVCSCKNDNEQPVEDKNLEETPAIKLSPNRPNLNISILLDLSDRINPKKYSSPAMEYYERDLGYIHSIAESFELHLRNKRSIKIKDHIQMYIDPEPSDSGLNQKIGLLNLNFSKDNAKKEYILKTSNLYDSISKLIYKSAIEDSHYVGSNIWGFFKSNVGDFCIEKDYRNILVILTDGYLFHKDSKLFEKNQSSFITPQAVREFGLNTSSWKDKMDKGNYGFIVTRTDLQDLEVLVLGINPDTKNPYEFDVINKYWSDWFTKMNVKNFEIKKANLPAHMDKLIRDFILKEKK